MNIILVVLDTMRYDFIGAYGKQKIKTPNLDRFCKKSWNFHNAYASSFPTIPHRTDVMTGQYGEPFHTWKPLEYDIPHLPRLLAEKGYCTQLIHDTPHLVNGGHGFDWPFHGWTQIRGAEVDRSWLTDKRQLMDNWKLLPLFDRYGLQEEEFLETNNKVRHFLSPYMYTNAHRKKEADWNVAKLFRTAGDFVRENKERDQFFLWVDCFDPHEPWDAPRDFMKMYDPTPGAEGYIDPRSFGKDIRCDTDLPPECIEHIRASYFAKVSFMDKQFGELLDALEETKQIDNTAIIVTSDHGTNVNDRDGWRFGKTGPPLENEAHVPLVLYMPGLGRGDTDMIAQPQDIFATALSMGGAKKPEGTYGHDLCEMIKRKEGARNVALCGVFAGLWPQLDKESVLFSAYDGEYTLHFTLDPAKSRLFKTGERTELTAEKRDVVARMHAAAIKEIRARGLEEAWADWLESGGKKEKPAYMNTPKCNTKPAGWYQYFLDPYVGS